VEPRRRDKLIEEINKHPDFKQALHDSEGWQAGWMAAAGGLSWCHRQNLDWMRQIWRALYLPRNGKSFDERMNEEEQKAHAVAREKRLATKKRTKSNKSTKRRKVADPVTSSSSTTV
jgi:hypothetical protein